MRKFKLDLDALEVQSFTTGDASGAGTVHGHMSEDSGCGPCDGGISARDRNSGCAQTCAITCGASCAAHCTTFNGFPPNCVTVQAGSCFELTCGHTPCEFME